MSLNTSLWWGREEEVLIGLNLWDVGVALTQEQVVGPIPTKALGWEIGRGGFSRVKREKVLIRKQKMNAGDPLSKCPF